MRRDRALGYSSRAGKEGGPLGLEVSMGRPGALLFGFRRGTLGECCTN